MRRTGEAIAQVLNASLHCCYKPLPLRKIPHVNRTPYFVRLEQILGTVSIFYSNLAASVKVLGLAVKPRIVRGIIPFTCLGLLFSTVHSFLTPQRD